MRQHELIIIIPARSGSKGIKNKNIISIKNKPLVYYSIKAAKKFKCKNKLIFCSTDSNKIKKICNKFRINIPFLSLPFSNLKIIRKNNLFLFVAYMMRFHPLIKKIKALIENKKKAKIFYATSIWGEYLPGWHPKENYKKSYAANKKFGGGVRLTLSHDLDLMCYLFGKIESMKRLDKYNSNLKINVDVGSTYLIKFKSGVDCTIHINYLNNPPIRDLKILGENIQIFFDYYQSKLKIIEKKKEKILKIKNFKRNDMFIEELKYFFKCLKLKKNFYSESDFDLIKFLI